MSLPLESEHTLLAGHIITGNDPAPGHSKMHHRLRWHALGSPVQNHLLERSSQRGHKLHRPPSTKDGNTILRRALQVFLRQIIQHKIIVDYICLQTAQSECRYRRINANNMRTDEVLRVFDVIRIHDIRQPLVRILDAASCCVYRDTCDIGRTPGNGGESVEEVGSMCDWIFWLELEPHGREDHSRWTWVDAEVGRHHFPDIEIEREPKIRLKNMVGVCSRRNDDFATLISVRGALVVARSDIPSRRICIELYRLHFPILRRFSAIIFGEAVQGAKEKLNVDDPVVRGVQPLPFFWKIFEWVAFFDLLSTPYFGAVST
jgi:hypothetical protein